MFTLRKMLQSYQGDKNQRTEVTAQNLSNEELLALLSWCLILTQTRWPELEVYTVSFGRHAVCRLFLNTSHKLSQMSAGNRNCTVHCKSFNTLKVLGGLARFLENNFVNFNTKRVFQWFMKVSANTGINGELFC